MINQPAERLWRRALSVLNPSCLIDRLLDRLDEMGAAILPAQYGAASCSLAQAQLAMPPQRGRAVNPAQVR